MSSKTNRKKKSIGTGRNLNERCSDPIREGQLKKPKSIGALFKAAKTKDRSPDMTGQIRIQRHTIAAIVEDLKEADTEEVIANIAAWPNVDKNGQRYITIELSPKFRSRAKSRQADIFAIFDNLDD